MLIYFALLFFVTSLALIADKANNVGKNILLFCIFLILVIFGGLRDSSIGTDTNNYIGMYEDLIYSQTNIFNNESTIENGYIFLQYFASMFSNEYYALLIFIMIFSIAPYIYVIGKGSHMLSFSIFSLLTLGLYLFSFNGARQAIASGFFSIAFYYLINRRLIFYFFWVFIASLFHSTALLFMPLYFIFSKGFNSLKILLIVSFFIIFILYFDTFIMLLLLSGNDYTGYIDRGAEAGYLTPIFHFTLTAITTFCRRYIHEENKLFFDRINFILIINALFLISVYFSGLDVNLSRLSLYMSVAYLFIWPMIFSSNNIGNNKFIVAPIVIIAHLIYFYFYILFFSDLYPFKFNTLIFS